MIRHAFLGHKCVFAEVFLIFRPYLGFFCWRSLLFRSPHAWGAAAPGASVLAWTPGAGASATTIDVATGGSPGRHGSGPSVPPPDDCGMGSSAFVAAAGAGFHPPFARRCASG